MTDELPDSLQINAWTEEGSPRTQLAETWKKWARTQHMAPPVRNLAAGEPADDRDWENPRVGWGLVVADDDNVPQADRAAGRDLPEPLRELVARRNAPILRYRKELAPETLRRYYADGGAQDLTLGRSKPGVGRGELPKYLLIWASPGQEDGIGHIPWEFQYVLNTASFAGRLHLVGDALARYVSALIGGWRDSPARSTDPVVWTVDHNDQDITHLMRLVLADPHSRNLREDSDIGTRLRYYHSQDATAAKLVAALEDPAQPPPAMILTTSHGMTGPLHDAARMTANLGLLVDQAGQMLDVAALLARWKPDGAIWYAHACCSAGSDGVSKFEDVVQDGPVKDILRAVAGLGAQVAPLPTKLLSAAQPLRAFIGHVEPTFDWTLRHPESRQPLTAPLLAALYDGLHRKRPEPVGLALQRVYEKVGQLFTQFHNIRTRIGEELDPQLRDRQRGIALRTQLTALDLQSCVILGDPTVALPALS
jgi:hypothetical protein